jgi:hypothetical protein
MIDLIIDFASLILIDLTQFLFRYLASEQHQ